MHLSIHRALAAVLSSAALVVVVPAWSQGGAEARNGDAASAAAASDEIRALDKQVQLILTEARRQQEQLAVQRQRLAAAEATNAWLPWLVLALLALAILAAGLGLRLWRLQRALAQPVAPSDAPSAAGPSAAADSAPAPPRTLDRPLLSPLAVGTAPAPAELALAQPRLMPTATASSDLGLSSRDFNFGTGVPPRPVSVEELLDLDQQVDFFLALGQAQSAIDLLLGHVRGTGGTSALPYFKLLEIYRQEGDEEAYERTRERFNQRFNAHAPDWTGDLAGGRPLEDYADVVQRLQRAWPQPMRAVAELEAMLLRRADLEPFDLPAYREVLMLHALVRDLPAAPLAPAVPVTTPAVLAREETVAPAMSPAASAAVDLLLPLGEPAPDITAPRPHLSERSSTQAMLADWVFTRTARARTGGDADSGFGGERPARPAKLDLDLSDYAPAPREFTRPAAFTDIDMRRDRRLSDLGGLDEMGNSDPLPSRR